MQEFFWLPEPLTTWVQRICQDQGLWLVVWQVGNSAELVDPESLPSSRFRSAQDKPIQLFLGEPSLCQSPVWRTVGDRREVDFPRSYAVQLVPSLVVNEGTTLLQGRIAILRMSDYEDERRAAALAELYRRLRTALKRESDARNVVVQPMTDGTRKRWKDVLVGSGVSDSGLKLKQFSAGTVEFDVEPA